MINQKLFDDYNALPAEAQRQVADFVSFLRQRYPSEKSLQKIDTIDLEHESFVGMWRNREDITDSSTWVRKARKLEWGEET